MNNNQQSEPGATAFPRLTPDPRRGLSTQEVQQRMDAGAHNAAPTGVTPSVGRIILKNTCTLFNFVNLALAVCIVLVGSPKNALFIGIALANTAMGIFQELRAKRTLDKLSILARGQVSAVRDGQLVSVEQDHVVLDDILLLSTGNQVCADGVVVATDGLEVDESLLTGEADSIRKEAGATVLSGSFVTAGQAYMRVQAVGANSYANAITVEAKKEKKAKTPLMRTLNNIIRVLTIAIFPLGALLFYMQFNSSGDLQGAVLGASAAMIGMIPEGLILLTGITLTVGALKLARKKALVQTLPSIETLARVDVLCLDKTGTITDGTLTFEELVPVGGHTQAEAQAALRELLAAQPGDNATSAALKQAFGGQPAAWQATVQVPFSSSRKWSGVCFGAQGSFLMGAPRFLFPHGEPPFFSAVDDYAAKGMRVLCLARTDAPLTPDGALPGGLDCTALIVLSDTIRAEAPDTFRFFENEGVTLKVISGDDPLTVSTIAAKAGIANADKYVDMSTIGDDFDLCFIVERFTVFGRVSPQQKRALIAALKQNGHTCCMTGDGVNDVLAMKEASCSVAMIGGSDAARGACDFVLMTSNFSAMMDVLREGRKVINNIESVACMYLVKTIYSTILSLIYTFMPFPYPFEPLQMTPINTFTVGIPSFFLALRGNYHKPEGRFVSNILQNSLPAALTVVFNILIVQLAGISFGLSELETSTMNVLLTGAVGFILLFNVSQPLKKWEAALVGGLAVLFLTCMLFFGWFFGYDSLFSRNVFFWLPLMFTSHRMFRFLSGLVQKFERAPAVRPRPSCPPPEDGAQPPEI